MCCKRESNPRLLLSRRIDGRQQCYHYTITAVIMFKKLLNCAIPSQATACWCQCVNLENIYSYSYNNHLERSLSPTPKCQTSSRSNRDSYLHGTEDWLLRSRLASTIGTPDTPWYTKIRISILDFRVGTTQIMPKYFHDWYGSSQVLQLYRQIVIYSYNTHRSLGKRHIERKQSTTATSNRRWLTLASRENAPATESSVQERVKVRIL